jgi:hypothetical protein
MIQTGWNLPLLQFIRVKSSSSKWLLVEIHFFKNFKSTGFTSSTFPIQPDFSQNQPAAITLNTGSPRTLVCGGLLEIEATSHMSQGLWPRKHEGPQLSSKVCSNSLINMVYWNLHWAYLLEVGMTQIPTNHETFFILCHVGINVDFSSMIIFLAFKASPPSVRWLGQSWPFQSMRDLRMQWPHAFNLMCKVAQISTWWSIWKKGLKLHGVSECKMVVKCTWTPTWHQMDHVPWSLGLFSKTTSWR